MKKILIVILLVIASDIMAKTTIYDARFWSSPDKTRLVFDISKNTNYKITNIKNTNKILISIQDVTFLKKAFLSLKLYKDSRIKKIYSTRDTTDLYVEITLKKQLLVKDFTLKPNTRYKYNRLVIDLYDKHKNIRN